MKEYKVKRLPNGFAGLNGEWITNAKTNAQVIRIADGKEMLDRPIQLSFAKRYADDMNNKNSMGLFLINKATEI